MIVKHNSKSFLFGPNRSADKYQRARRRGFIAVSLGLSAIFAYTPAAFSQAAPPTQTPAPASGATKALDAMLTCKTDFFEILKSEKAAFGPASLTPGHPIKPNFKKPVSMAAFTAQFLHPVEAHGLHLTAYTEVTVYHKGRPDAYYWGFHLAENPEQVSKAIDPLMARDVDRQQKGPAFGWLIEMSEHWIGSRGGIEHLPPLRMLIDEASGVKELPGAALRCAVFHTAIGPMKTLPAPQDVIQITP